MHVGILEEKSDGFGGEKEVNWETCACMWQTIFKEMWTLVGWIFLAQDRDCCWIFMKTVT